MIFYYTLLQGHLFVIPLFYGRNDLVEFQQRHPNFQEMESNCEWKKCIFNDISQPKTPLLWALISYKIGSYFYERFSSWPKNMSSLTFVLLNLGNISFKYKKSSPLLSITYMKFFMNPSFICKCGKNMLSSFTNGEFIIFFYPGVRDYL